MAERNFVNGLRLEKKEFKNGGFIINCGVKYDDFIDYLNENLKESGWVNFDIKFGKESGKPYAEISNYDGKKTKEDHVGNAHYAEEINEDEIPF